MLILTDMLYFSVKAWNEQRGNSQLLHRFITVAINGVCERETTSQTHKQNNMNQHWHTGTSDWVCSKCSLFFRPLKHEIEIQSLVTNKIFCWDTEQHDTHCRLRLNGYIRLTLWLHNESRRLEEHPRPLYLPLSCVTNMHWTSRQVETISSAASLKPENLKTHWPKNKTMQVILKGCSSNIVYFDYLQSVA